MTTSSNWDRYKQLANPLHSILFERNEQAPSAPQGKFALSSDTLLNEGLYNALAVASWALPLSYLVARIVNKKAKKDVDKAKDKAVIAAVNSLKPRMTPNADLTYDENNKGQRKEELSSIEAADKALTADAAGSGLRALMGKRASFLTPAVAYGAPLSALAVALYLGAKRGNKDESALQAKELDEEYARLKTMQDAVDADILQRRGLIQIGDIPEVTLNKEAAEEDAGFAEKAGNLWDAGVNTLWKTPQGLMVALFALTALGGSIWMHNKDKNAAKLKYLKEHMLGANRMGQAPEVSMDFIPGVLPSGRDTRKALDEQKKAKLLQTIDSIPAASVENTKKEAYF